MRRLLGALLVVGFWLGPLGVGAGLVAAALVPLPERLSEAGSVVVDYRDGTTAHVFLAPDERWRVPVALDEVDPAYVTALVALEDERFWWHPGVDPAAIARAAWTNLRRGRVVSGASTLTMQLVRVLEPRPRTLKSKGIEALRAMQLELHLSKEEILEAYLTFTPYGRNVEGLEAAALSVYGHRATHLSADEIATLLAIPQDPNRRYPREDHRDRLRAERDDIAGFLRERGALPEGASLSEIAVPETLRPFPREVPHAAIQLHAEHPDLARIATTLDRETQRQAERVLARHRSRHERDDIHNAAVVVVDHHTGEVRALVGSFDFWEQDHGGQIAAYDVPRSPGSALKPFIYAQAIDRGLVLPERLVEDLPSSFGDYVPENYDGDFDGLVRLEEALSRSLNLPFISLLRQVGVDSFLGHLELMGVESLVETPGWYGLSVAAGGVELTALEVAGLYAALANGGTATELRLLADAESGGRWQAFSTGATWLTRRALSIRDRPDFPARRHLAERPPAVAWKTGTSFGHRDAWAAGWDPDHTVVVWSGNVDMSSTSALVGARASGPILFDLLEAIGDRDPGAAPPPRDLVQVELCSLSGHLPGPACEHTSEAWALRSAVPTERCPFHQGVEVDVDSGLAVAPGCRDGMTTREESVVTWPASVRRYLRSQHAALPAAPSWHPDCGGVVASEAPVIRRPEAGRVHLLVPGLPVEEQEVPLEADLARADARVSWFVDGVYLGTVTAEERVWWTPSPGRHDVVVVDGVGRRDRRVVEVGWL